MKEIVFYIWMNVLQQIWPWPTGCPSTNPTKFQWRVNSDDNSIRHLCVAIINYEEQNENFCLYEITNYISTNLHQLVNVWKRKKRKNIFIQSYLFFMMLYFILRKSTNTVLCGSHDKNNSVKQCNHILINTFLIHKLLKHDCIFI